MRLNHLCESTFNDRLRAGPAAPGSQSLPRLFILAIGVNRTSPLLISLEYATNDAESTVLEFKKQEGKLFSEVHALVIDDSPSDEIKRLAGADNKVQVVSPVHAQRCGL